MEALLYIMKTVIIRFTTTIHFCCYLLFVITFRCYREQLVWFPVIWSFTVYTSQFSILIKDLDPSQNLLKVPKSLLIN